MLAFFFQFLFLSVLGLAEVAIPSLTSPVIDLSGVVSSTAKARLESELRSFQETGRAQIQVLVLPTLDGEPIESFSIRAVEGWKLGDAKKDNGVLIVLVTGDRKSRIEVGGGLEGELTDLDTKRILADLGRPFFQRGDYESGLRAVALGVMDRLSGLTPVEAKGIRFSGPKFEFWLMVLFIVFSLFFGSFNRRSLGRTRGGFYGGGWPGGGSWGSGGGGGWSGGGGGFSGGGSSDSW